MPPPEPYPLPTHMTTSTEARLLGSLLTKLPAMDPAWPAAVQDGWMRCFASLQQLAECQHPQHAETQERAAFEEWVESRGGNRNRHQHDGDRYASATVQGWWRAWQARAARGS